jgi:hypothetical protein
MSENEVKNEGNNKNKKTTNSKVKFGLEKKVTFGGGDIPLIESKY